jgi:DNA polymerase III subunit epsilon
LKLDDPVWRGRWEAPLDEAEFCFVDLEMTGLDVTVDRVCEICLVRTRGRQEVARLESLVLPESGAGGNAEIHGLDEAALAGAPSFADLWPRIEPFLEGTILVGHAVLHDVEFLVAEAARLGRTLALPHTLDTLPLSRRCLSLPSHRLTAVAEKLAVPLENHHRAAADVGACLAIFFILSDMLAAKSPRDLDDVKIGSRQPRAEIVALALAAEASREEVWVRYRPARRPAEEVRMVITAVLADLDPPRVMGYLAVGRSRRELRADRILAISSQPTRTETSP